MIVTVLYTCYVKISDHPEEEGDGVGGQLCFQAHQEPARVGLSMMLAYHHQKRDLRTNLKDTFKNKYPLLPFERSTRS